MNKIKINAINLIRYIVRLGFLNGISFFYKTIFGNKNIIHFNYFNKKISLRRNTSDIEVFDQVFVSKQYEFDYIVKLQNVNNIIDLGANIGLSAIWFKNKYSNAKIYCVEPDESNCQLININSNHNLIKIIKAGVWYKNSYLKIINNDSFNKYNLIVQESNDSNDIKGVSIDWILSEYQISLIDILKIDIEGAELEIFSQNYENWIPKTRCLIIELHDRFRKGTGTQFFKTMSKYNFSYYNHKENIICINNEFDI